MKNLAALLLGLATFSLWSSVVDAREVFIDFAASPPGTDSSTSLGHAWIIIEEIDDNGRRTITSYGWYPKREEGSGQKVNALDETIWYLEAIGGISGGELPKDIDDHSLSNVYLRVPVNAAKEAKVRDVIKQWRDEGNSGKRYDPLIVNCVRFDVDVARALELKIPLMESVQLPVKFAIALMLDNADFVRLPFNGDPALAEVARSRWDNFIKQATDLNHIQQDLRWRAYQSAKQVSINNQARAIEDARANMQVAENGQNRILSAKAAQDEAYYKDAFQRSLDNQKNMGRSPATIDYGGGSGQTSDSGAGGGNSGGSLGSGPCTSPGCIYYPVPSNAWVGSTEGFWGSIGRDNPGFAASLIAPSKFETLQNSNFGSGYLALSLEQKKGSSSASGYNYILSLGAMPIGEESYTFMWLTNISKVAYTINDFAIVTPNFDVEIFYNRDWDFSKPYVMEPGEEVRLVVRLHPTDITQQPALRFSIKAGLERSVDVILDYSLLANSAIMLGNKLTGVTSGLGGRWNDAPYKLSLGPAPLFYKRAGQVLMYAYGQRERSCVHYEGGFMNVQTDNWLKCWPTQKDDANISWDFTIQGLEGGIFGRDDTVYADAQLYAEYHAVKTVPSLAVVTGRK